MGEKNSNLRTIFSIGLVTLSFASSLVQVDQALAASPSNQALILLAPGTDINATVEVIEQAGGHVTHIFPSIALIADVPVGVSFSSSKLTVYRQIVDELALTALSTKARRAAQVWNGLLTHSNTTQDLDTIGTDLAGSAMDAPPPEGMQPLAPTHYPIPGYAETSEYLIGRVAVGIVLPESNGSIDASTEDWTADERAQVLSEITAALNWWATLEPNAHITFIYDDGTSAPTSTSYEPISRQYGDQSYWISEIMATRGYTNSSYFDQVRNYNNDLRDTYDTDWAFTIFVVDSSADSDGRFANGRFAYAYLGGPFFVMTYNNYHYGPENIDAVAAHETGHIFHALDQYTAAHQPCTFQSGYLGVENQNSQYGSCISNEPSIMRGQISPYTNGRIDEYARGQIGWRDSDGDSILDPMDTTLSVVSSKIVTSVAQSNVLTFTGSVQDDPYPSPLRRSVTINTVEQIQYRIAGGEWMDAQPTDGKFDTYAESFIVTTQPLPTGDLDIDLRVLDSAGNELIQTIDTISVIDPVDNILDTTMTRMAQQVEGDELTTVVYNGHGSSAVSHIADMFYRIDNGPWQSLIANDGTFDEPQEDFDLTIDLSTLSPGNHQIQAYSVDGEGNIETSPASDFIHIQPTTQYVFLPLVMVNQ
ncbi:MAG: hypothetical protein GY832_44325 [Chloroflexi bacterium]|nr:hypothetical protein [Chloroflexota bacterium]